MSFSRTVCESEFRLCCRGCFPAHTWALDVADDGSGLVVHELDAALSNTTTGACKFCQPAALAEHSFLVCICRSFTAFSRVECAYRFGQGHE